MNQEDRIKVGVFFGGISREREISFAGGRTVYDNLDKSLFQPILIFIDSLGSFIQLDWQYIYKGSIRDFWPAKHNPQNLYIESHYSDSQDDDYLADIERIGQRISIDNLKKHIDFAFLCLHGVSGEDGQIQGLLEFLGIPYSGSMIAASAIGMDKARQLKLLSSNKNIQLKIIGRKDWIERNDIESHLKNDFHFPLVVRPANQGSSIGVNIVQNEDELAQAIDNAFFIYRMDLNEWHTWDDRRKNELLNSWIDIRSGLAYPILIAEKCFVQPQDLYEYLESSEPGGRILLQSWLSEHTVIIEDFIEGREFSCVVVRDHDEIIALPPTEIQKGSEVYDYQSKYLPGRSRKLTPMDIPHIELQRIQNQARELFDLFEFQVYARIDGFYKLSGEIILNDPNTTSGMLPSSFFFHQSATVGWTPSGFLSFIIAQSFYEQKERSLTKSPILLHSVNKWNSILKHSHRGSIKRTRIAIILGGFSSERHISVESGRNIFEKINGSGNYVAQPIFLNGDGMNMSFYKIPIDLLLKDNADDILKGIHHRKPDWIDLEQLRWSDTIERYQGERLVTTVEPISIQQLSKEYDFAFIALHGRPGEDGHLQGLLEAHHMPYNGSGPESASLTIDKFRSLQLLRKHGFQTAHQWIIERGQFDSVDDICSAYSFDFPVIAKPVDDGCSSAVMKIHSDVELEQYLHAIFREDDELDPSQRVALNIGLRDEFPRKDAFLIEEWIHQGDAQHFLEITGGFLSFFDENLSVRHHVFHPSETIAHRGILSLEEKFLAGGGTNITPPRYSNNRELQLKIDRHIRNELQRAIEILKAEGYGRFDAFVKIYEDERVELLIIELNSLPGMTPATAIFHQAAHEGLKPLELIEKIIHFGIDKHKFKNESVHH